MRAIPLLTLLIIILQGCVAVQPFPTHARKGDTITLALGQSDHINKSGYTVTYRDANNIETTLPSANIRSVFKLYPDKRSGSWKSSTTPAGGGNYGNSLDIMVLDLPDTLVTGPGELIVTSTSTYAPSALTPNDVVIPINIIAGDGASSDFSYHSNNPYGSPIVNGNLGALGFSDVLQIANIDRVAQDITVPSLASVMYGAVEINMTGVFEINSATKIEILLEDLKYSTISQTYAFSKYDSGGNMTVYLVSPEAEMIRSEINFYILNYNVQTSNPAVTSVKYFDGNGVEVSGSGVQLKTCSTELGCI